MGRVDRPRRAAETIADRGFEQTKRRIRAEKNVSVSFTQRMAAYGQLTGLLADLTINKT